MNYYSSSLTEFFDRLAQPVSPALSSSRVPSTALPPSTNPSVPSSITSTPLSNFSLLAGPLPRPCSPQYLAPDEALAALALAELALPPSPPYTAAPILP